MWVPSPAFVAKDLGQEGHLNNDGIFVGSEGGCWLFRLLPDCNNKLLSQSWSRLTLSAKDAVV